MKLEDISYANLSLELDHSGKGEYSRKLYLDSEANEYIKIWEPDYYYLPYFTRAYQAGFYHGISMLKEVIEDQSGYIRGYITHKCIPPATLEAPKLKDLVSRVAIACKANNMVYIDFVKSNIVEHEGQYQLIDLEAVIPSDILPRIPSIKNILEYNNYHYRMEVLGLIGDIDSGPVKACRQCTPPNKDVEYGKAPGRVFLEKEYLPALEGSTLFVGINYYTEFYHKLVQDPDSFETIDVDKDKIPHGSPYVHWVGDIRSFDPGYQYDNVCFFGILGHADSAWEIVTDEAGIMDCLQAVHKLTKPGGTLLLGPSTQECSTEFWEAMYQRPQFENYDQLMLKKIDINYIWHGRKHE